MGSQYLDSGESIVMTTHRVSVDYVEFDLMLTTRRLILIDSRYARFEPRNVPFSDMGTVNSGKTPTGEPAITITLNDRDEPGTAVTINLIFSQQSDEKRKNERDQWLKKIMEYIVAVRQEAAGTEAPPADKEAGIRPSTRRWLAPEVFGPKKDVARALPVTQTVIPEPLPAADIVPPEESSPERITPPNVPEPVPQDTAGPDHSHTTSEKNRIPEETILPVAAPEYAEVTSAASLPEQPGSDETPVSGIAETAGSITPMRDQENSAETEESPHGQPDLPEIIVPVFAEPGHYAAETEVEASGNREIVPSDIAPRQVPFVHNWHWVAVIAAALIVVLAVAGFGAFYLPNQSPVTTANAIPVTTTPAITATTTAIPPAIPQSGVWVEVSYPGNFGGWIGNAGNPLPVSGTGTQIYKVLDSSRIVQASIQKQDNTGDTLSLIIYRDGTAITNRSTRIPLGTIDVLIDPVTGYPPGTGKAAIPATATASETAMYF